MKLKMKAGFAIFILLLVTSCSKEKINGPSAIVSQSVEKASALNDSIHIGAWYQGGIIFWIDSTKVHGLIADTADLGYFPWWNGTYIATGATAKSLGKGLANTRKIIAAQGKFGYNYAALKCARYKGNGYIDWFLPSSAELSELHRRRGIVGGFTSGGYWSSTELDGSSAIAKKFDIDSVSSNKADSNYVRAVRIF